VVAGVNRQSGD